LALQEFGSTVLCESPSRDGYEVENILKEHSLGFLAEHFVKPPCDVIISFKFPVNISHVGIIPRVATLSSEVISLFICDQKWEDVKPNKYADGLYFKYCGTLSNLSEQTEGSVVYIENPTYKKTTKYEMFSEVDSPPPSNILTKFEKNIHLFHKVYALKLRITKTKNFCPPCIGKVEVRGLPSPICSDEVFRFLKSVNLSPKKSTPTDAGMRTAQPLFQPLALFKHLEKEESTTILNMVKDVEMTDFDYDIPKHYFDPITYELMYDPVVLPSGHTVDNATISRHMTAHSTDPFTGLPLHQKEVVPNQTLKRQIESYITARKRKRQTFQINTNDEGEHERAKFKPFSGTGCVNK